MTLTETRMSRRAAIAGAAALTTGLALRQPATASTAQDDPAIAAAVELSGLEVDGQINPLYQRLHPDAVAEVPFYAVQYWYENDFLPRGPELIEPTGVEYVDWTWEVTGVTYPDTAEVSFSQVFADGETVEDVVRLVEFDGEWCWLFGRDRAFVDEQISLGGEGLFPAEPSAPPDWATLLVALDADAIDFLPEDYSGEEDAALRAEGARGQGLERYYADPEGATVARILFRSLDDDESAADAVNGRVSVNARVPGFEVLAWDVRDEAGAPFAICQRTTGPVNQDVVEFTAASPATGYVWTISAPDEDAIDTIVDLLIDGRIG